MVGMRQPQAEKRNKLLRTVYIIYEGRKTEPNYFHFFADEFSAGAFTIDVVPKDSFDKDNTDRDALVQMMEGYVKKVTNEGYTPFQFVTEILKDMFSGLFDGDKSNVKLAKDISNKRKECINKLRNNRLVDRQGLITDRKKAQQIVIDSFKPLMERNGIEYHDLNPDRINSTESRKLAEDDRIFIVFDRDEDISRMESTYLKIFDECDRLGYEILLSTPHFELWLLMHHDTDFTEFTMTRPHEITMTLERLEEYHGPTGRYKCINKYRYDRYYRGKFEKALKVSHMNGYSLELRDKRIGSGLTLGLINNIGSNVGIKLKGLL